MKTVQLVCPDISCHHCVMTIKRELGALSGVTVQNADVETKTVTLQVDSDEELTSAVALLSEIGYPPAS